MSQAGVHQTQSPALGTLVGTGNICFIREGPQQHPPQTVVSPNQPGSGGKKPTTDLHTVGAWPLLFSAWTQTLDSAF